MTKVVQGEQVKPHVKGGPLKRVAPDMGREHCLLKGQRSHKVAVNKKGEITMSEKTQNQPTHRVTHVVGEGEKTYWQNIGVAWPTKERDGFSFVLNYMPTRNDGRLLILPFKENEQSQK